MKVLAIVESLTGNTMSFVDYLKRKYEKEVSIDVVLIKKNFSVKLDDYDKIMIGCYTWDSGRIPKRTKNFIIENRDTLLTKDIMLFGSGWSMYEHFCGAVNGMGIILEKKFPEVKFELRFDPEVEHEAIEKFENFIKKQEMK